MTESLTLTFVDPHRKPIRRPGIAVYNGYVTRLNADACRLLDLQEGDRISIATDEDEPGALYIYLSPDAHYKLSLQDSGAIFTPAPVWRGLGIQEQRFAIHHDPVFYEGRFYYRLEQEQS